MGTPLGNPWGLRSEETANKLRPRFPCNAYLASQPALTSAFPSAQVLQFLHWPSVENTECHAPCLSFGGFDDARTVTYRRAFHAFQMSCCCIRNDKDMDTLTVSIHVWAKECCVCSTMSWSAPLSCPGQSEENKNLHRFVAFCCLVC